ncbi:MAG: sodium/glutamate symporter, partial [Acholeplasmataceae bacterium]|nr:sodium/glutamate symporter [Acholeplasmataceae bacterium]
MNFWEFELNTFDVWVFLGILVIVFLLANVLRRKVGFIRSSLLPTALIGGLIMLILKSFGLFDQLFDVKKMNKFMESVTYHTLALGVIALTLKSTTKDKNKEAQKQIFNAGLITVNTYLIQAIVGTALTVLLAVTFLKDLFPAAGLLLPLGFGQGSGQANNFGSMFQTKHGFVGGTSFGLSIATIGFLVAGIVGVFHINLMRRKGRIKIGEDATFTSIEETVSPNEIPVSETVDRLSIQAALIMVVYFITF